MSSFYEKLPVYKKALDLVVYIEKIVQNFSRYHKYTVGTELRNLSRRILMLIAKANAKQERKATLLEIIEKLEELKILVRICKEIKVFRSFKSFEFTSKSVIEVTKQCEGWLRSQN
ncbi:four helix bundle protein [bacterium]|nr:four helix bundle protein [bacterium]